MYRPLDCRLSPDVTFTPALATAMTETVNWSDQFLGVPAAWKHSQGAGVKVCVLDTGIDEEHPDLQGQIFGAKDFTFSRFGPLDRHGHGTHVASLIAANANEIGIHGIAPQAKLLIAKVLGDDGGGGDSNIAAGIQWGLEQGADVFSLSLGGPAPLDAVLNQVRYILDGRHVFFLAAAGNDGGKVNYPAAYTEFISVGACDEHGRLTDFTSKQGRLDIVGPGVAMLGCVPRRISASGYARMTGTSQATPCAAAVAALALAKHRSVGGATDLTNTTELREHLQRTAVDGGGYRLLNAQRLLETAHQTPPAGERLTGRRVLGPYGGYALIEVDPA